MNTTLRDLPVFGICGHSGAGKTTLIEALVGRLLERDLSVAVVKFHAHGIDVDREGKDSDRFFRAGADVFLHGPDQGFVRTQPIEWTEQHRTLWDLVRRYDVILVEGRKRIECEKVWLLGEGETSAPPEAGDVIATLPRDANRIETVCTILEDWLTRTWLKPPVYGCVLIGGQSTRMGRPKHLIEKAGRTWLEHVCEQVAEVSERVVVVGRGSVPDGLAGVLRLPDVPDARGPAAGILAAMRWAPGASWLLSACDLPNVSADAFRWLLSTRAPGVWATMPRLSGSNTVEPLLAHYDFRAREILEALLADGHAAPSLLADHPKVITPAPPRELAPAWTNVNTPNDLKDIRTAREG